MGDTPNRSARTWYPLISELTPLESGEFEMSGRCPDMMVGDIVHATTNRPSPTYRIRAIEYTDPDEFVARVTPVRAT